MKLIAIVLLALTIGTVGVMTGASKRIDKGVAIAPHILGTKQQSKGTASNPAGTIDGAKNPEMIPDQVAYSLFFRLIAARLTVAEKNHIRAYVKQALGCQECNRRIGGGEQTISEDKDIDALITAAEEFQQRIGVLDRQVKEIKDRNWPNPNSEVIVKLTQMQQQKEALVADIVASLPGRLSVTGLERMRWHINDHVKRRVKMAPGPQTPPGGFDWRQHLLNHQRS